MEETGPLPQVAPVAPQCETAPVDQGPPPAHCVLCGRAGGGWGSAPLTLPKPVAYRCDACYRRLPDGALFCPHCGRKASHGDVAAWRATHEGAGRLCAAAAGRSTPAPAGLDDVLADPPGFENIRQVGLCYGAMLGVSLIHAGWVRATQDTSAATDFFFSGLLYVVILVFAWRWRALLAPVCRWPQGSRLALLAIPLTPLLTLATVEGQSILARWLGWPVYSYLSDFTKEGFGFDVALVFVAVLPAIFEEIAFRGLILRKLLLVMPAHQAMLVTSLLFAILHFNVVGLVVFLVPLAYAAAWVTEKTRSLLPAMAIHFLHNAGVLWFERLNL